MDHVLGFLSDNSNLLLGGGVTGIVAWVLKKVPNEQISNIIETFFYGLGKTITLLAYIRTMQEQIKSTHLKIY